MERITTVNNEVIKTIYDDVKQTHTFPVLYKTSKLGKTMFWSIYTHSDTYYRESGMYPDGKVKTFEPTTAKPKNVGKKNETSASQQALLEAFSEWKHKKNKELYVENLELKKPASESCDYRPMLAQKYEERKKYITFPCAVSRKLDGVRCMIFKRKSEEKKDSVVILSRQGIEYSFLEGIRSECKSILDKYPNIVLDGELYSHTVPFNVISGVVRSKNTKSKYDDLIHFHIFDYYDPNNANINYLLRINLLKGIAKNNNSSSVKQTPYKFLDFVFYDEAKNEHDLIKFHDKYVSEGYEGLIIRNYDGIYELGQRSNNLQKYKDFEDSEFKVVNVLEAEGNEKGGSIFVCETSNGDHFSVRPRGSIEKRRFQFKNKDLYIGKYLTVRYQNTKDSGPVPRFPVGISMEKSVENLHLEAVDIRDYE